MQVRYQAALRPDEPAIITEGIGILLYVTREICCDLLCEIDLRTHNGSFFIFQEAGPGAAGGFFCGVCGQKITYVDNN
ncbi:MAG: hypothetical protein ABI575_03085 [Oxalobacteraceae bacterium]